MRDYGKILPRYWTGGSGASLRGNHLARLLGAYLFSAPTAHPIGIYYLPLVTLAHEMGCPIEGARKGLRDLEQAGIAFYDEAESIVWVPEMARVSIGERLSGGDKRRPWLLKELGSYRKHKFFRLFVERYGEAYKLGVELPEASPIEGASEDHRRGIGLDRDGSGSGDGAGAGAPLGAGALEPLKLDPAPERKRKPPKRPETTLPDGWGPKPAHYGLGADHGMDRREVDRQAEKFKARAVAKAVTYVDWDGGFRTWILNAEDYGPAHPRPAAKPLEARDGSASMLETLERMKRAEVVS